MNFECLSAPQKQYFLTQVEIQQLFNKSNIIVGINHGGIIALWVYVCGIPRLYARGNGIYNYSKLEYNILQRSRICSFGNRPKYSRNGQNMRDKES
jgi:hypothetical protein